MNADPVGTRYPHLDLEDLIAEASGQEIDERVLNHLASCEHCRAEADRWNVVADGVLGTAVAPPEVPPLRHMGLRTPSGPRRRVMLAVSAAAAVVLLGGVGYGAATAPHAPGAKAAVLTAVSGCAGLEQATGTLEQVSGTTLVIKTASGQLLTVTTTPSTVAGVSVAPLSDITDGAVVVVGGKFSDGTIAASIVSVGQSKPISGPNSRKGSVVHVGVPNGTLVQGRVTDAIAGGFTLVTSDGTRILVTTSSDTLVNVIHAAPSQLLIGRGTAVVGYAGQDGTLSATVIIQPSPAKWNVSSSGKLIVNGCSPASVDSALTAAYSDG